MKAYAVLVDKAGSPLPAGCKISSSMLGCWLNNDHRSCNMQNCQGIWQTAIQNCYQRESRTNADMATQIDCQQAFWLVVAFQLKTHVNEQAITLQKPFLIRCGETVGATWRVHNPPYPCQGRLTLSVQNRWLRLWVKHQRRSPCKNQLQSQFSGTASWQVAFGTPAQVWENT